MFEIIRQFASEIALLFIGIAIGGAWVCIMVGPNVFFDRLDAGRADTQTRALLKSGSTPIAGLLLAGAACCILAGSIGAGITAMVAAVGFFTNRWTLASFKKGETPPGAKRRRKTTRIVAVSLSLIFLLAAVAASVLAILGI